MHDGVTQHNPGDCEGVLVFYNCLPGYEYTRLRDVVKQERMRPEGRTAFRPSRPRRGLTRSERQYLDACAVIGHANDSWHQALFLADIHNSQQSSGVEQLK